MHELSIAQSLVDLLLERLAGEGRVRVTRVRLRVGELAGVVPEALEHGFDAATRDTPLEGARLAIESVPVVVWCDGCGAERAAVSPSSLRCSVCGELAGDVRGGRELQVVSMEVDDAAENS